MSKVTNKPKNADAKEGLRFNEGKPKMSLIDGPALVELAKVLTEGAKKYAPHNWRKGLKISECLDSLLRHVAAFNDGENVDFETRLSHIAHVMCNAMFIISLMKNRPHLDDRWRTIFEKEFTDGIQHSSSKSKEETHSSGGELLAKANLRMVKGKAKSKDKGKIKRASKRYA